MKGEVNRAAARSPIIQYLTIDVGSDIPKKEGCQEIWGQLLDRQEPCDCLQRCRQLNKAQHCDGLHILTTPIGNDAVCFFLDGHRILFIDPRVGPKMKQEIIEKAFPFFDHYTNYFAIPEPA